LKDLLVASDRADQLADELSQVKPELKAKGCAVRVIDVNHRELYRTPLRVLWGLKIIAGYARPHLLRLSAARKSTVVGTGRRHA